MTIRQQHAAHSICPPVHEKLCRGFADAFGFANFDIERRRGREAKRFRLTANRANEKPFTVGLAMLAFAGQSQALYTNFLNDSSNTLAGAYTSLTNNPSLTRQEQCDAVAIQRALKEFRKPSASVAMDCGLFAAATAHLGPLTFASDFLLPLTNAFTAFVGEAQAEINLTAARIIPILV